jgi:hypothetical protein
LYGWVQKVSVGEVPHKTLGNLAIVCKGAMETPHEEMMINYTLRD